MAKRRPNVEIMPKSGDTIKALTSRVNTMMVTLNALLADLVMRDPNAKNRLLVGMSVVRQHPATIPELKEAYDRAIDIIQSLRT